MHVSPASPRVGSGAPLVIIVDPLVKVETGRIGPLSIKEAPLFLDTAQLVIRCDGIPGNDGGVSSPTSPRPYSLRCVFMKAATMFVLSSTAKLHSDWLFLFVS